MQILAKKRLKRRSITPVNNSSVKSLYRLIETDTGPIPSQYSSQQKFIPFVRERDAIGRLITIDSMPKLKINKTFVNKSPISVLKPKTKQKNNYKGDVPPIGLYTKQENWIKKSFSNKTLKIFFPVVPTSVTRKTLTPKEVVHYAKPITGAVKKENQSVQPRKKGIWEDIQIYNTPDIIKNILSFKKEVKSIVKCQLNISKSLEKLKNEYFL